MEESFLLFLAVCQILIAHSMFKPTGNFNKEISLVLDYEGHFGIILDSPKGYRDTLSLVHQVKILFYWLPAMTQL